MYNPNLRTDEETGDLLVRDSARGYWYAWEPTQEQAIEMRQDEYSRMRPRERAMERRRDKAKYTRRRGNAAWARRQRREDRNAQVIY